MTLATQTVIAREVAWLSAVDSLPALLKTNVQDTPPFDVIAAYWPRQPGNLRAVYVTRNEALLVRNYDGQAMALNRVMSRHAIRLRVWWPVINGDLQTAQPDLDAAVDLLLQRVKDVPQNKTHGGRFLSAGEGASGVKVTFADPERAPEALRADVFYVIDDLELIL